MAVVGYLYTGSKISVEVHVTEPEHPKQKWYDSPLCFASQWTSDEQRK